MYHIVCDMVLLTHHLVIASYLPYVYIFQSLFERRTDSLFPFAISTVWVELIFLQPTLSFTTILNDILEGEQSLLTVQTVFQS